MNTTDTIEVFRQKTNAHFNDATEHGGGGGGDVTIGTTWKRADSIMTANSAGAAAANATALNSAIAAGQTVYLGSLTYHIGNAINLASGSHILGDGARKGKLLFTDNTKHGLVATAKRDIRLHDFVIEGTRNATAQNAGFRATDPTGTQECFGHTLTNMEINFFHFGVHADYLWWSSSMKDVKLYANNYSMRVNGVGRGGTIQNTFTNVYSFNPIVGGFWFEDAHRQTFVGCNAGAVVGNNYFVRADNCSSMEWINGNFEGPGGGVGWLPAFTNTSPITAGASFIANDGTRAKLRGCSFITNGPANTADVVHEVALTGGSNARVWLEDVRQFNRTHTNMKSLAIRNSTPLAVRAWWSFQDTDPATAITYLNGATSVQVTQLVP